ncbi:hypothetical protein HK405_007573, partial [Cladochytrium tenue]
MSVAPAQLLASRSTLLLPAATRGAATPPALPPFDRIRPAIAAPRCFSRTCFWRSVTDSTDATGHEHAVVNLRRLLDLATSGSAASDPSAARRAARAAWHAYANLRPVLRSPPPPQKIPADLAAATAQPLLAPADFDAL